MSNKSREEGLSERDKRSCSVVVKSSDDNSNNINKKSNNNNSDKNNNNKRAAPNTWTTNVNNSNIENAAINDEINNSDAEVNWWQALWQTICFTRPQSMPLWFEILLFGLLSACFLFFPWSANPVHILFIALSFFFAIVLCTVYLVLYRITLHRARHAAEQEWDEYHFKAAESLNSLTSSIDAVNNNNSNNNNTTSDHFNYYNSNNEENTKNTASTHIPLLQPPPPPPPMLKLTFEENAKMTNYEQRALAHFINAKYTHHVEHVRRRVITIVSSLQLLLLGLLVLLSPMVMGVWTATHDELESDVLNNSITSENSISGEIYKLAGISWRRLVQLAIIDNVGDARHRFGVQTYPNEINIKVCLLHAWFLFAFNLPFAMDFIIGLVHLAVAMAFYHYETSLTMLFIALWMSVPLINMIASCVVCVCCYCCYRHHHHRNMDGELDVYHISNNASYWWNNKCSSRENNYNNNNNNNNEPLITFVAYEENIGTYPVKNITTFHKTAAVNAGNNIVDSKKINYPITATKLAASQQQRNKTRYWELDNYNNADEHDAQSDVNINTLAYYPFAHQITRTEQGVNVFQESNNDFNEQTPEDIIIVETKNKDVCNIITSTVTPAPPTLYSPREKTDSELIANNKHHGPVRLISSSTNNMKHKNRDRIVKPEKEKQQRRPTKVFRQGKHSMRPQLLLSLHGERDRLSLMDFVVDKEIADLSYMFVDPDDAIIRLVNAKFADCVGTVTSSLLLRRLHDVLIWLQVNEHERVMSELKQIKMKITEVEAEKTQSLPLLSSSSQQQEQKEHRQFITENQLSAKIKQNDPLLMSMRKNDESGNTELFVFCKRITLQGKCPYNVLTQAKNKDAVSAICESTVASDKIVLHPIEEKHQSTQEEQEKCSEQREYIRPVFVIHLDVILVQNQNLFNFRPCLLLHTPRYHEYCNALGLPVAILRATDGTIVFWSTNAAKYTGISESAILSFPALANFTFTSVAENEDNINDNCISSSSSDAKNDNDESVLRGRLALPTSSNSTNLSTHTNPLRVACSLRLAKGEQAFIEQERIRNEVDLHISHNDSCVKRKYSCRNGQENNCHKENISNDSRTVPEWLRFPQLRTWAQTNSLLLLLLEEKLTNRKHDTCNHIFSSTITNTKSLLVTEKVHEFSQENVNSKEEEEQEKEEYNHGTSDVCIDDKEHQEETESELQEESYILADGSSNVDNNIKDEDVHGEIESQNNYEESLKSCIGNESDQNEIDGEKQYREKEEEQFAKDETLESETVTEEDIPAMNSNHETNYNSESDDTSVKSDAVVEEVMNASNYEPHHMQYVSNDNNNNNNICIWSESVMKTEIPETIIHLSSGVDRVIEKIWNESKSDDVKEVDQSPLTNANMKTIESNNSNNINSSKDNSYLQVKGTNRPRRQVLISPPIAETNYSEVEKEQINNLNITSSLISSVNQQNRESEVMEQIDADVDNNYSTQYNDVENALRDGVTPYNVPYAQSSIDGSDGGNVKSKALDGKPPFVLPLAMEHSNKNNNIMINTSEHQNNYSASRTDNTGYNIENEQKINTETNDVNHVPHGSSDGVLAIVLANPSIAVTSTSVQEKQITWGQLLSRDEGTIASCFIRTPLNEPFRFGRSSRCELCVHDSFVSSIQFTLTRTLRVQYKNSNTTPLADDNLDNGNVIDGTKVNSKTKEIASRSYVVTLQDKSVNGTYVNVKKIGKDKTCVLHDGDLITFRLSTSQFFLGFVFRFLYHRKTAAHRTRKRKQETSFAHHAPTSKPKDNVKENEWGESAAILKRRENEVEPAVSEMLAFSLHSNVANGSKSSKEFNESTFNKSSHNKLHDSALNENQFSMSGIVQKEEHLPWHSEEEEEEEQEFWEKSQSAASAPATPATLPYSNNNTIHADNTNFAETGKQENKKAKGNMKQSTRSLSAFWVQRRLSLKQKLDHRRSASAHLNSHANHSLSSANSSNQSIHSTRHRTMSETQRPKQGWSDDDQVIRAERSNLHFSRSQHGKSNPALPRVESDRLSNYKNSGSRASSSFTHSTQNNYNNYLDSGVGEVRIREITSSSPYIREYESAAKSGSSVYEGHYSGSGGGGAPYHEQASSTSLSASGSVEEYNSHEDNNEVTDEERFAAEHHERSRHGSDPYSTSGHRGPHHRRNRTGHLRNSSYDHYPSQPEDEYHHYNNNNNSNSSSKPGNNSFNDIQYQHNRHHHHQHHHHNRRRETIEWKIGEEMLGKGGNAEVYLGINLTNGQLIAVKRVLLPTAINDVQRDPATTKAILQQYRSLQEEINVLSKAIHPNIVRYYGSSQNKTYFNILLEFVPGGSLRHLLDNFGALSPGVIFSYLRQALEGLRYLHAREIVHGDIKTANILISEKGQAKLTDFGTARLLNRQHASMLITSDNKSTERKDGNEDPSLPPSSLNRRMKEDNKENHTDINNALSGGTVGTTLRLGGTLRWMDPALFRLPSHISTNNNGTGGDNITTTKNRKLSKTASESLAPSRSGPSKASDIWSVGCALIEMMSGEGPWYEYEFESEEQIINLLKYTTEPPEIPECAECPELMTIAQMCLQLAPESRPTCEMLLLKVIAASERLQSQMQTPSASPARDSSGPLINPSQFTDNISDNNNNKTNDKHTFNSNDTNTNNSNVATSVQNKSFRSQSHKNGVNNSDDDYENNDDSENNNKEKQKDNVFNEAVHDVKSTFKQSEGFHDYSDELHSKNNMESEFAAKDHESSAASKEQNLST